MYIKAQGISLFSRNDEFIYTPISTNRSFTKLPSSAT